MDLTEAQWQVLRPLLTPKRRPDGRGRPWRDARSVVNGERHSLGFANRCSLARSARPLPALSNLSSPFSVMAARRNPDAAVTRAGRRFTGAWQARSLRNLYRRQLQLGEKRGPAVGPTRRGKGSKIMAIADRHGLPV